MIFRNRVSRTANEELFFFKLLIFLGAVIGFFQVPNSYLTLVPLWARYPALLYLIFQNIALLDFGFKTSEYLWNKTVRRKTNFFAISMCIFFCFCVFLILISSFVNWFIFWLPGCGWNRWTLICTSTVTALLVLLGFVSTKDRTNFTAGAWAAFVLSLGTGSLLASSFQADCNPVDSREDANNFFFSHSLRLLIDLGISFLAVCYSSLATETSQALTDAHLVYIHSHDEPSFDLSKSLDDTFDEEAIRVGLRLQFQGSISQYRSELFINFHVILVLFLAYIICAFFQWGQIDVFREELWSGVILGSQEAFYGKAFTGLVLVVLFVWVTIVGRTRS